MATNIEMNLYNGSTYTVLYPKTSGSQVTGAVASATNATQLATSRTIDGINFNGSANIYHYGTCTTSAATAAKTVTKSNFVLSTGAKIAVKFSYTNTAASPTLNVNSTGAKNIYYHGSAIPAGYLVANEVLEFVYDGTNYIYVGKASVSTADTATSATQLATSRTIRTNLASTSTASFNGTANITPGVTGTLPIANGGTAGTTASSAIYNLIYPLTSRSASNINSYASTTYVPCYYSSTGYKMPISALATYIQNQALDGETPIKIRGGSLIGDGKNTFSFTYGGFEKVYLLMFSVGYSTTSFIGVNKNVNTYNILGFNTGNRFLLGTPSGCITQVEEQIFHDNTFIAIAITLTKASFTIGGVTDSFNTSGLVFYWQVFGV